LLCSFSVIVSNISSDMWLKFDSSFTLFYSHWAMVTSTSRLQYCKYHVVPPLLLALFLLSDCSNQLYTTSICNWVLWEKIPFSKLDSDCAYSKRW